MHPIVRNSTSSLHHSKHSCHTEHASKQIIHEDWILKRQRQDRHECVCVCNALWEIRAERQEGKKKWREENLNSNSDNHITIFHSSLACLCCAIFLKIFFLAVMRKSKKKSFQREKKKVFLAFSFPSYIMLMMSDFFPFFRYCRFYGTHPHSTHIQWWEIHFQSVIFVIAFFQSIC